MFLSYFTFDFALAKQFVFHFFLICLQTKKKELKIKKKEIIKSNEIPVVVILFILRFLLVQEQKKVQLKSFFIHLKIQGCISFLYILNKLAINSVVWRFYFYRVFCPLDNDRKFYCNSFTSEKWRWKGIVLASSKNTTHRGIKLNSKLNVDL